MFSLLKKSKKTGTILLHYIQYCPKSKQGEGIGAILLERKEAVAVVRCTLLFSYNNNKEQMHKRETGFGQWLKEVAGNAATFNPYFNYEPLIILFCPTRMPKKKPRFTIV